jgi:hypothetical protein
MDLVKNLEFEQEPDYELYCKLFEDYMLQKGWEPSSVEFDWAKKETDEMLDSLLISLEQAMDELEIKY